MLSLPRLHQAADQLEHPPAPAPTLGWDESLAAGAAGIALLHIERARSGCGRWEVAHRWAAAATRTAVSANPANGLFLGAPAVAFALAAADQPGYAGALRTLNHHITSLTHRRLERAHTRIDRGQLPMLAEYDLINGLTGIGCYLLHHQPDATAVRDVLSYLVRLTEPLQVDGEPVSGWWTRHGPTDQPSLHFPTGHGNLGMAHGITGPLALLATAANRGITVDGHTDAIARICNWLDQWRQGEDTAAWWPPWITLDEQRTCRTRHTGPQRPSWCYGTPGLARAQQLAGRATGDTGRQQLAEQALLGCMIDQQQLAQLTDPTLCHGWAGLLQTLWRVSTDAGTAELATQLPRLRTQLAGHHPELREQPGLLEGEAGVAVALHTTASDAPPASGWDACLLISG